MDEQYEYSKYVKFLSENLLIEIFIIFKQDMKLQNSLWSKYGESLDEKSLTICSGTDYINVNYQHIVCPDAETAKVSIRIDRERTIFIVKIVYFLILHRSLINSQPQNITF